MDALGHGGGAALVATFELQHVVTDLERLFVSTWQYVTGHALRLHDDPPPPRGADRSPLDDTLPLDRGGGPGAACSSPG